MFASLAEKIPQVGSKNYATTIAREECEKIGNHLLFGKRFQYNRIGLNAVEYIQVKGSNVFQII